MGYFLNGLHISAANNLHNIEQGRCCKPRNHPDVYGSCYDENVGVSFEREGWTNCSKLGYYITGVYRGSGNWLRNIDKFKCCQMAAAGNEIISKNIIMMSDQFEVLYKCIMQFLGFLLSTLIVQ